MIGPSTAESPITTKGKKQRRTWWNARVRLFRFLSLSQESHRTTRQHWGVHYQDRDRFYGFALKMGHSGIPRTVFCDTRVYQNHHFTALRHTDRNQPHFGILAREQICRTQVYQKQHNTALGYTRNAIYSSLVYRPDFCRTMVYRRTNQKSGA